MRSFTTDLTAEETRALGLADDNTDRAGYCKVNGIVRHFSSLELIEIEQIQHFLAPTLTQRDKDFLSHQCMMRALRLAAAMSPSAVRVLNLQLTQQGDNQ